jgi:predicted Zn-dependent protease
VRIPLDTHNETRESPGDAGSTDRSRRPLAVIAVGVVLAIAAFAVWDFSKAVPPQPLAAAEDLASRLIVETDAKQRAEMVQKAEQLLRDLAQRNNGSVPEVQNAFLLLAGLQSWRGRQQPAAALLAMTLVSKCTADNQARAALLFFSSGDVATAGQLLSAAQRRAPRAVAIQRASAMIAYDLGHDEETLQWCRQWAEQEPSNFEPWRLTLQVYEDRGHAHLAVDACRELLRRSPPQPEVATRKLIQYLIQVGDQAEARKQLDAGLREFDPTHSRWEWRITSARVQHLEGQTAQALAELDSVLAEQPNQPDALHLQGRLLLDLGELPRAIETLTNASRRKPIDSDVQYLLGQAYARDQQLELAEKHLQLHRQLRDTQVRINTLERQAGLHPNDHEVRQTLANLYESLGLTEQARQWRTSRNLDAP